MVAMIMEVKQMYLLALSMCFNTPELSDNFLCSYPWKVTECQALTLTRSESESVSCQMV